MLCYILDTGSAEVASGLVQEGHAIDAYQLTDTTWAVPARIYSDENLALGQLQTFLDQFTTRDVDPSEFTETTKTWDLRLNWPTQVETLTPSEEEFQLFHTFGYQTNTPDWEYLGITEQDITYEDQICDDWATPSMSYNETKASLYYNSGGGPYWFLPTFAGGPTVTKDYLVLDLEAWDIETQEDEYNDTIDAVRALLNQPSLKIGFWSRPPKHTLDWNNPDNARALNATLTTMASKCDFVAPELYFPQGWEVEKARWAFKLSLQEARQYGLPVFAYIASRTNAAPYDVLTQDQMQMALEVANEYADGVFFWSRGSDTDWDTSYGSQSGWWAAVQPYLTQITGNGPYWFLPTFR